MELNVFLRVECWWHYVRNHLHQFAPVDQVPFDIRRRPVSSCEEVLCFKRYVRLLQTEPVHSHS